MTAAPIVTLFREWQAAKSAEKAVCAITDDEDETDRAWLVRYEVEKRLMREPSRDAREWMLKLCAWTNFGDTDAPNAQESPQLWAEARALVGVST
ncbi:hypothetical protein [Paenirhodobacter enshiensis]|uniref:hypothetical protein n=1 Tax=Paenirhodobacter enshiensis TaxID=1105367 RepID=UPI0035AFA472